MTQSSKKARDRLLSLLSTITELSSSSVEESLQIEIAVSADHIGSRTNKDQFQIRDRNSEGCNLGSFQMV